MRSKNHYHERSSVQKVTADRSDLASKVFQTAPKPAGSVWRDNHDRHHAIPTSSLQPTTQGTTTCHSRRRRPRCPTLFNHQQHIPQARKGFEKVSLPKPSDAGDHGHSKPVYLLPSSVRKRDSGTCASATSQMFERQHSRGPRDSRIRCGGICLQF